MFTSEIKEKAPWNTGLGWVLPKKN
jgi:hypothetical protein